MMAELSQAMPFMLMNEDGKNSRWFYQSPHEALAGGDPGGETVHGVSRGNWPAWAGWKIVDSFKGIEGFPQILLTNTTLNALVASFYKENFWDKILGDKINSQLLAIQIFDSAVNQGVKEASKLIQDAINFVENCVAVDGDFGPLSLAALNRLCYTAGNSDKIMGRFLDLRKATYQSLAAKLEGEGSPEANDLKIWLSRCVVPTLAA